MLFKSKGNDKKLRISVETYNTSPVNYVRINVRDGDNSRIITRSIDSLGFVDISYIDLDDLLLLTERAYEAGKSGREFELSFREYAEDGELYAEDGELLDEY